MRASILVCGSLLAVFIIFTGEALSRVSQRPNKPDASDEEQLETGRDLETGLANAHQWGGSSDGRHYESKDRGEFPQQEELDDYGDEGDAASEGSSRSVGGEPAGIPPQWLILSWYQQKYLRYRLLAGYMVRLNDNYVMTHRDTCINPEGQYNSLSPYEKEIAHRQIQFLPKEKINTDEGPGGIRLLGCHFLGGESIALDIYVYRLLDSSDSYEAWNKINDFHLLKTKPPIQDDPEVKDDCYLYSYSGSWNAKAQEQAEMTFSKLKVNFQFCRGYSCTFKTMLDDVPYNVSSDESGKVCPWSADSGAPILCGKEEKLSYLTLPSYHREKNDHCVQEFETLRLADHSKRIDTYLKMERSLPKQPFKVPEQPPDFIIG